MWTTATAAWAVLAADSLAMPADLRAICAASAVAWATCSASTAAVTAISAAIRPRLATAAVCSAWRQSDRASEVVWGFGSVMGGASVRVLLAWGASLG